MPSPPVGEAPLGFPTFESKAKPERLRGSGFGVLRKVRVCACARVCVRVWLLGEEDQYGGEEGGAKARTCLYRQKNPHASRKAEENTETLNRENKTPACGAPLS